MSERRAVKSVESSVARRPEMPDVGSAVASWVALLSPGTLAFSLAVNSLSLVSARPMTVFSRSTAVVAVLVSAAAARAVPATGKLGYNEFIQPILAENCFNCHGPDSASRKAKLRLDRFEFATKARGDGDLPPAIVPGNPAGSPLIERLHTTDPEEVMPPPETHKRLRPEEIALLERWIKRAPRMRSTGP